MKKLIAAFYQDDNGREPVREWLKKIGKPDSTMIGEDIKTVEFGWPIGMPTCRPLGQGLFEVRSHISGNRIARVLFCIHGGFMVLLHAFIKKTQETPGHDMELALERKRKAEIL